MGMEEDDGDDNGVLALALPFPLVVELGLGKGRALVGLTAANANADVVTWLILTVGVAFAGTVGRRWPRFVPVDPACDKENRLRCESKPIRILELHFWIQLAKTIINEKFGQ